MLIYFVTDGKRKNKWHFQNLYDLYLKNYYSFLKTFLQNLTTNSNLN